MILWSIYYAHKIQLPVHPSAAGLFVPCVIHAYSQLVELLRLGHLLPAHVAGGKESVGPCVQPRETEMSSMISPLRGG